MGVIVYRPEHWSSSIRTVAPIALALCFCVANVEAQSLFRGNAAHTGVYPGSGPHALGGVAWKFATGGRVFSSPVYDHEMIFCGSDDGNVYALDASTGAEKWRFATHGPVDATPAVDQGVVYVGSYDGAFYALDEATGKQRWKFDTAGERRFEAKGLHGIPPKNQTYFDAWDMFLSSPVVGQGAVFFGSGDGNVYALDQWTGAERWKFKTGDVVHASPAYAAGTLYVGSWDSYLYALDTATGTEKWRFKTGDDPATHNQVGFQSSPAVVKGVVYVGCRDSHLYAVDTQTGQKKWDYDLKGSWVVGSPAVTEGTVYFGTSDTNLFIALEAETGKLVYQQQDNAYLFSSPAIAGGVVYVGKMNGGLIARDRKTGQTLWEYFTESSVRNEGGLLKPDRSRNEPALFRASDLGGVAGVERIFSLGAVASSPLVADGLVYFGSTDGNVYALKGR
jgi:outer membrane protein assembly factor BamB